MCLAAIAVARNERFPWVLVSNRDEFFDRPALPLAWWQPQPGGPRVLSGRDLSAGGTWLGLTEAGALALVTNVREPGRFDPAAASRGALVLQWLQGPPHAPGEGLAAGAQDLAWLAEPERNGFNLYAADLVAGSLGRDRSAFWFSNRAAHREPFGSGVVGLSNAALDTPWPKVRLLKQRLQAALDSRPDAAGLAAAAFAALADRQPAPDAELPETGIALQRERQLSSACIRIEDPATGRQYGTRCATLVFVERMLQGLQVRVIERTFAADGAITGEVAEDWRLPSPGV
jgi:uncharacterized protein with NRDE domain